MKFFPTHYWTAHELHELKAAMDESQYGRQAVFYRGQWVRFTGIPTITIHGKDIITIDGLGVEEVEPPV